ncbi:MAG TPA: GNAT family N-acetyltransferase [Granulicella sp.]|jgi:ribosomal protein S18 acetylase RimI-like enzyme
MDVRLRPYRDADFEFARQLYFRTMRWAIERLFGWDQTHQEASFATWFNPQEVSLIIADGVDVGWVQLRSESDSIFLGSIYIEPLMQRKGVGTRVIRAVLDDASPHFRSVTLAVMKINPATALYERLGFKITHEDKHKLYMKAERGLRVDQSS